MLHARPMPGTFMLLLSCFVLPAYGGGSDDPSARAKAEPTTWSEYSSGLQRGDTSGIRSHSRNCCENAALRLLPSKFSPTATCTALCGFLDSTFAPVPVSLAGGLEIEAARGSMATRGTDWCSCSADAGAPLQTELVFAANDEWRCDRGAGLVALQACTLHASCWVEPFSPPNQLVCPVPTVQLPPPLSESASLAPPPSAGAAEATRSRCYLTRLCIWLTGCCMRARPASANASCDTPCANLLMGACSCSAPRCEPAGCSASLGAQGPRSTPTCAIAMSFFPWGPPLLDANCSATRAAGGAPRRSVPSHTSLPHDHTACLAVPDTAMVPADGCYRGVNSGYTTVAACTYTHADMPAKATTGSAVAAVNTTMVFAVSDGAGDCCCVAAVDVCSHVTGGYTAERQHQLLAGEQRCTADDFDEGDDLPAYVAGCGLIGKLSGCGYRRRRPGRDPAVAGGDVMLETPTVPTGTCTATPNLLGADATASSVNTPDVPSATASTAAPSGPLAVAFIVSEPSSVAYTAAHAVAEPSTKESSTALVQLARGEKKATRVPPSYSMEVHRGSAMELP